MYIYMYIIIIIIIILRRWALNDIEMLKSEKNRIENENFECLLMPRN